MRFFSLANAKIMLRNPPSQDQASGLARSQPLRAWPIFVLHSRKVEVISQNESGTYAVYLVVLWIFLSVATAQRANPSAATSTSTYGGTERSQSLPTTNRPTDVEVDGFGTVEFPGSMTRDQIQDVLNRKFPGRTCVILDQPSTNNHVPPPPDGFVLDSTSGTSNAKGASNFIEKPTRQIYSENRQAVVLLLAYDSHGTPQSLGSGFYFETNKIASNFHVVDGADHIEYRVIGSREFRKVTKVESVSKALDLAILDVAEPQSPVTLANSGNASVGDKVVAIGNPRGLEGSVSEGIVSAIRGDGDLRVFQITAPISPGSSGGPLFLANGQVIGITTATLRDSQSLNFAVPASLLLQLRDKGEQWEPVLAKNIPAPETGCAGVSLISPEFTSVYGELQFSLMNNNQRAIENIAYLLVFKDQRTGNFVNFITRSSEAVIPPGLAKRYNIRDESLKGFLFRERYPYNLGDGYLTTLVDVELRVLTYDFFQEPSDGGVLDVLQH